MKNPVDSFAAALRAARARRHLTQRALAEKLHMSVPSLRLNSDAATHDLKRLHCWQKK